MTSSFDEWLLRMRAESSFEASDPSASPEMTHPVPALPATRPRTITPRSSQENLRRAASATASSAFFQKLPYEIRRRILIEAFGGHIVHMDLTFDHPEVPRLQCRFGNSGEKVFPHCNRNRIEMPHENGPYVKLDESEPKRWIWRSSECHRAAPPRHPANFSMHRDSLNASEDRCRYGGAEKDFCSSWRGLDYNGCFIGAMGWLLSCHQAYTEGIDVLYTTNTIHTASKQMILNLDKLLLPQRLWSIRSVELVWEFVAFRWPHDRPGPFDGLESYHRFLEAIPVLFPNVRSMTVCLQGVLLPYARANGDTSNMTNKEKLELTEPTIMRPVDDMVRKLGPQVQECNIAIAGSLYRPMRTEALHAGGRVDQVHLGAEKERHWCPLSGDAPHLKGYWVVIGQRVALKMLVRVMDDASLVARYPRPDEVFYPPWYLH